MIKVVDSSNFESESDTLRKFAELRYEVFVRRLGWQLPRTTEGRENDEYDAADAIYLTIGNKSGNVIAGARLLNTAKASILTDRFPHLVNKGHRLPRSEKIFEVTRFAIDNRRDRLDRRIDLRAELLWGMQAVALGLELQKLVSISYLHLEPMLRKCGYRFRRLGDVVMIDGIPTAALEHEVAPDIMQSCRRLLKREPGLSTNFLISRASRGSVPPAVSIAGSSLGG